MHIEYQRILWRYHCSLNKPGAISVEKLLLYLSLSFLWFRHPSHHPIPTITERDHHTQQEHPECRRSHDYTETKGSHRGTPWYPADPVLVTEVSDGCTWGRVIKLKVRSMSASLRVVHALWCVKGLLTVWYRLGEFSSRCVYMCVFVCMWSGEFCQNQHPVAWRK